VRSPGLQSAWACSASSVNFLGGRCFTKMLRREGVSRRATGWPRSGREESDGTCKEGDLRSQTLTEGDLQSCVGPARAYVRREWGVCYGCSLLVLVIPAWISTTVLFVPCSVAPLVSDKDSHAGSRGLPASFRPFRDQGLTFSTVRRVSLNPDKTPVPLTNTLRT
jgi:hypothetical protein